MARIELDPTQYQPRPGLTTRLLLRISRRAAGKQLDSVSAAAHHPGVLVPLLLLEGATMATRSVLPGNLAPLAAFVATVKVGCAYCVDLAAAQWQQLGLDPETLGAAVGWRDHPDQFDELHLLAFEYCEAVTTDPLTITDDLSARLREIIGERGLVELTYWAALANMRSRFNAALGIAGQGFSSGSCALIARTALVDR